MTRRRARMPTLRVTQVGRASGNSPVIKACMFETRGQRKGDNLLRNPVQHHITSQNIVNILREGVTVGVWVNR